MFKNNIEFAPIDYIPTKLFSNIENTNNVLNKPSDYLSSKGMVHNKYNINNDELIYKQKYIKYKKEYVKLKNEMIKVGMIKK
jgi:hypothetical protein